MHLASAMGAAIVALVRKWELDLFQIALANTLWVAPFPWWCCWPMAVILWHCLIELLTPFDLDFIFRKWHIPVFASSKLRIFVWDSFLHPFSDGHGEDADLVPRNMGISAIAVWKELSFQACWVPLWQKAVSVWSWLCVALWGDFFFVIVGFFSPPPHKA